MANHPPLSKSLLDILDDIEFVCDGVEIIWSVHNILELPECRNSKPFLSKKELADKLEALKFNRVRPLMALIATGKAK